MTAIAGSRMVSIEIGLERIVIFRAGGGKRTTETSARATATVAAVSFFRDIRYSGNFMHN